MKREFEISTLAVVVLVLLRIALGWHFLHEGVWKAAQPSFTAKPYLQQSKGPLANWYRGLIPDTNGERRLDIEQTREYWSKRIDAAEMHFNYSEGQTKAAKKALDTRLADLDDFLREEQKDDAGEPIKADGKTVREYKPAIRVYKAALARWKEADAKRETKDIPFEQKRHWDRLQEMQQTVAPWLAEADRLDAAFTADLERIAAPEEVEFAGDLPRPTQWLDWLEPLTTYSLIGIGVCLILGFATRLAAVGGAIFMLTAVVLPQLQFGTAYPPPPPSAGHTFIVTKEVIEMLALLAIALTPAGRWAGLDYIGYGLFHRYYDGVGDFLKRYIGKAVGRVINLLLKIMRKGDTRKDDTLQGDKDKTNEPTS